MEENLLLQGFQFSASKQMVPHGMPLEHNDNSIFYVTLPNEKMRRRGKTIGMEWL